MYVIDLIPSMGHADISIAMNVYTHLGFEGASEEINRIANEKQRNR